MKRTFSEFLTENVSLVILIGVTLIATALSAFEVLDVRHTATLILAMLAALSLYELDRSNKEPERIKRSLNDLVNRGRSQIYTQKEFYVELLRALEHAKHEALLTHFETRPPEDLGIREKSLYFKRKSDIIKDKNIQVRQLVSVGTGGKNENLRKLTWIKEMIDNFKDCQNFQLRCIEVSEDDKIHRISTQIIDRSQIFIVDINNAHRGESGVFDKDLWTDDSQVAETLYPYFDLIWNSAISLKDGARINNENLTHLENRFNAAS